MLNIHIYLDCNHVIWFRESYLDQNKRN